MLLLCVLLVAAKSDAHEDKIPVNSSITTLYPVGNATTHNVTTEPPLKSTNRPYTAWTIDTVYTASNLTEERDKNYTVSKEGNKNITDSKEGREEKNLTKVFRPSQHLGSFFDHDDAEVIKKPILGPLRKPATGFVSSPKDEYHSTFIKLPKDIYQTYTEFPYKFESAIYAKSKGKWHFDDSIQSKPTVEIPVKVPAGGLYQSQDAFKEKPLSSEEFSLAFNEDGRDITIKKRANPWQHLLRLMTAFIPVGLIISALTPNVITIQEAGPKKYPSNNFRRSDGNAGTLDIAPISESCRRRLLCELHSDRQYISSTSTPRVKKHCYKIHCEDTQALWRMLQWLLAYHEDGVGDRRARRVT